MCTKRLSSQTSIQTANCLVRKSRASKKPTDPKSTAIYDPNTNLTLWESGAIITYLIEQYDKEGIISYTSAPEKYLCLPWQHLQATGQGPYFGQAAWFNLFHPEKLESAQARYAKELLRLVSVLDRQLAQSEYLVGNKCTYADLSFVTWNASIAGFMAQRPAEEWDTSKFTNFQRWHESLMKRPSVQKALAMKEEADVKSG